MVDRSSFDRLIAAGGYCSTGTGQAPDGNALPVGRDQATRAFNTATCIGCGACVASCRNASASLFVAANWPTWGNCRRDNQNGPAEPDPCRSRWQRKIRQLQQQFGM